MDSADFSGGKSPRRELLGPGRHHSKSVKTHTRSGTPGGATTAGSTSSPVIIYTVSPKIIHTQPSEFMTLVQRLTGLSSSSSSSAPLDSGAVSPAARFASIEKTKVSAEEEKKKKMQSSGDVDVVEGIEIGGGVERSGWFPGILSPGPSSLPQSPRISSLLGSIHIL
ncbi:Protein MKS1 [Vitis vinifera]|uniref:Protein MKS1 n=1 Tax=Vitis vinifera TaxID=29760 RepID=A0A438CMS1_VITVI|nr:Protein MKS1 [Vitis vinifera]